jgi:hypothetical protein
MEQKLYHLFEWTGWERGSGDYEGSFATLEDAMSAFHNKQYDCAEIYKTVEDGSLIEVATFGKWNGNEEWRKTEKG